MGRYNLAPQRVHTYATQLLNNKRISTPPPWYTPIAQTPPSERLTRPPMQRSQKPGKKASRLFKPLKLHYEEDRLRWEYFNDHPWELARPRVVLEDQGRDGEMWDWSVPLDHGLRRPRAGTVSEEGVSLDDRWDLVRERQSARPLNGEAVIQRQHYLQTHSTTHTSQSAYDLARKEFYAHRHALETESRVAREEALSTGAFFGPGPNEIGMGLESQQYETWKKWAEGEIQAINQVQGAAYTGLEAEGSGEGAEQELEGVSESLPASRRGLEAGGGAGIHP